jgi:TonB family protein
LDVLGYLYRKGFVHGHIKPANIMASRDQLKVSSDGLCRSGESLDVSGDAKAYDAPEYSDGNLRASYPLSPAGDIWSLGVTLVETLTQSLPAERTVEGLDPLLSPSLLQPFHDIASHCLLLQPQSRWTIAQIADRLEGRAPIAQPQSIPPSARVPSPAAKSIARASRPFAKRKSYRAPIAIASALVLAAVLAGPKLVRRHSDAPPVPAATVQKPPVTSAPKQSAPPLQEHSTEPSRPSTADEEQASKAPVAVPASLHPETMREGPTNTAARFPEGSPAHGEVAHQATPEVLQSARASIRGTVRVSVKVNVDRSGNVEDAELESRGPSRYFSRAALEAAQDWKFKAPEVGGRGVLSTWILRFEFTRDGTTVVPTQEMP